MESLVSVIVPVYNVEQYLDKCIFSIVNQTYHNLIILLVDDGSSDSSYEKCNEWAKKDSRIQVIHKENGGVGSARNLGLDIATGDYIIFVDSDDYLSFNAIEIMVRRIELDHSDLVVTKWATIYEDGRQGEEFFFWMSDSVLSREQILQMFGSNSRKFPVFPWGKLYRAELFQNIRYNSFRCGEDLYILPHIIDCCKTVSIEKSVTYFYYQRATSLIHVKNRVGNIDLIKASLHVSRFLFELGYIEGSSRFYYSAICKSFETKGDKEVEKIIKDSYNKNEKKLLRKYIDKRIIKNLLIAIFPSVYQFYKLHIKRENNIR